MTRYRVAIVGATGVVGETLARVLGERRFPMAALQAFATARSAGSIVRAGSFDAVVEAIDDVAPDPSRFDGVDVAFFAVGDAVSAAYGRALAARGTLVIDKSAAFRMDSDVPLIVPEVNGVQAGGRRLLANPNCATIPLALALAPVERAFGLAWTSAATYQSVSGAGRDGAEELAAQLGGDKRVHTFARRIAGNVIPEIGRFGADGETGEERKVRDELRKILGLPSLPVSATTVRVPVAIGHSAALSFGTLRQGSRGEIAAALARAPGVTFLDGDAYETPLEVAGTDRVTIGRLRRDGAHDGAWMVWVVSDNLRKGAATNAVQIAETALATARVPA